MKVLVACEFSGTVRDAFIRAGHEAMSCDLLPTEKPGPHYQRDVREILHEGWDLLIAHPPCTHLAISGARWFYRKQAEQAEALAFVQLLLSAPIHRIALENPIGVIGTRIRKADQIIHPYHFGHGDSKATCLWLKNLPPLRHTNVTRWKMARAHNTPDTADRWKHRSRTYTGIAEAMAQQWGAL